MGVKYTWVNQETCIACGACGASAPDIYGFEDNGIAFVLLDKNQGTAPIPEELWEQMEEALEDCPTESIQVSNHEIQNNISDRI
ncbi:ferredoxin [Metabacillus niabensis]|uniref:ferredoxin n=1 Tax=Metabacillus niabensis TaxID=324854 RepID=UPI0039A30B70